MKRIAALGLALFMLIPVHALADARTPDRRQAEEALKFALTCDEGSNPQIQLECGAVLVLKVRLTRLRCTAEPTRNAREIAGAVCTFLGQMRKSDARDRWVELPGTKADFRLMPAWDSSDKARWRVAGDVYLAD